MTVSPLAQETAKAEPDVPTTLRSIRGPSANSMSNNLHQSETRPQFPEAIKCFCGAVDYTFGTALHTAIQSNQAEVVEMLLKRNDCNLNIHAGETFSYAIIIA